MDAARLGLAHGPVEASVARLHRVRAAAATSRREIGIIADLPGPKIRAGAYPEGGIFLVEGATVDLAPRSAADETSSAERTVVDHADLLADLRAGDLVAL